ncbi:hypothetical protein ED733_008823 [Metarhizium rileyi]|uniref:Uncharacterized protein n=1 Tax=Metarhizium rileyi (strain RCEF 4871) TaxID=1649241 RepID=A0A5C6GQ33_METRR|nr:hypothetical protein ED733_008823 [Metarhizium rileyi]
MALTPALSLLPASLLIFVSQALAASGPFPTAIKKQSADSSEKILKEHLAFAPIIQATSLVVVMARHVAEEWASVHLVQQAVQQLWVVVAVYQALSAKASDRIDNFYYGP